MLNFYDCCLNSNFCRTDIDGAIIAGVAPSISYKRRHQLLPCALPVRDMDVIITKLRPRLQSCNIDEHVTNSIIAACIFMSTMRTSKEQGLDERFDPENLLEDYDFLQYDLLRSARWLPIRRPVNYTALGSLESTGVESDISTQDAAEQPLLAFEEALRIVTLMCLRAATMQGPWSKQAYSRLLAKLAGCLQIIIARMCEGPDGCSFVDPSLLHGADRSEILSISSARPFLIWMCMLGYQFSIYHAVYHDGWSDHRPENCIYLRVLAALGLRDDAAIERLHDNDLLIFETINLEWATGKKWYARDMLRWMISGSIANTSSPI